MVVSAKLKTRPPAPPDPILGAITERRRLSCIVGMPSCVKSLNKSKRQSRVIEAATLDGFIAQLPSDLILNTDESKAVAWLAIEPPDHAD